MKTNNKHGITTLFMAILLVSIAFIPAVSASSDKEVISDSAIVTPATVKPASFGDIVPLATYSIVQGQTRTHSTVINKNTWHFFRPELSWTPSSNSLRLTVVSPTGTTYGPWYDSSGDGVIDGRIHFTYPPIQIPAGLPVGTWTSRVYGSSVSGTATYQYDVYIT